LEEVMKVRVIRELCTGHGLCALKCAELYKLDDNGYIDMEPLTDVPPELEMKARRGAIACPEGALKIEQ